MKMRLIIILAAISIALLFQGCVERTEDVSLQSPYSELMNKKFILHQDCYIYKYLDDRKRLFVGNYSRDYSELPKEVSSQFLGKQFNSVIIVGIVPKGSVFTIVRLEIAYTFESSYRDVFASFEDP